MGALIWVTMMEALTWVETDGSSHLGCGDRSVLIWVSIAETLIWVTVMEALIWFTLVGARIWVTVMGALIWIRTG